MKSIQELQDITRRVRVNLLRSIHTAGGGHTGGSLSSVDILTTLFFRTMRYSPLEKLPDRDRFILSKGHSAEGFYAVLAEAGFIPLEELWNYGTFGAMLYGHPTPKVPGVEVPTGALGHGLSIGVGMAIAAQRDQLPSRVFVLMGDGEQAEGSVWEAAMSASHYRLGNLVGIIDHNKLQISGTVDDVMTISSLRDRWSSFGWRVFEVDGNNMEQLVELFDALPTDGDTPIMVVAHTVKGKGVSFIENNPSWHHKVPSAEELQRALEELGYQTAEVNQ